MDHRGRGSAGSENANNQGWMWVEGYHPEYQPGPGQWVLYNYCGFQGCTAVQGGGHIERQYDFGYHAWGP